MSRIGKRIRALAFGLALLCLTNTIESESNAIDGILRGEQIVYAKEEDSSQSIIEYSIADPMMYEAEKYAWDLLQNYAVGENYLNDPYITGSDGYYSYDGHILTEEQQKELRDVAFSVTEGLSTDYEKIEAIMEYVAKDLYYDLDFYNGITKKTYVHPYDVWTSKISVCAGYSRLVRTFLIFLGIPCMDIYGNNHEYNVAYDRQNEKWIFVDATWASGNRYSKKHGMVMGKYRDEFFDPSIEYISNLKSHEIYNLYDLSSEGKSYWLSTDRTDWSDISKWTITLQAHAGRQVK